jgi:hypothetical protein
MTPRRSDLESSYFSLVGGPSHYRLFIFDLVHACSIREGVRLVSTILNV